MFIFLPVKSPNSAIDIQARGEERVREGTKEIRISVVTSYPSVPPHPLKSSLHFKITERRVSGKV